MSDSGDLKERESCVQHDGRMIAPIIVTVVFVCYYVLYFVVLLAVLPGLFFKVLCGVIPFVLAGVTIFVCIQRINEIRSGEEDDLSKY